MKRIIVIGFCTIGLWHFGFGQVLNSLNGSLNYQYQFQDYTSAGVHSNTSTQSPTLNLGGKGYILDPAIVSFDLRTFLNLSSSSSRLSQSTLSSKSFSWDYYNLALGLLAELPVSTSLVLSDGYSESQSKTEQYDMQMQRLRRQQQNLTMMSRQISFLPTTNFSIYRTHQWSLNPGDPVDQLSTSYSLSMSSGGQGGSVNVSGMMSDNLDRFTGYTTRYYTLLLHGTRNYAIQQNLNYDINYNKLGDAINILGSATYMNAVDKNLQYLTTLSSRSSSVPSFQSKSLNLGQTVKYIQNENFQYNFGVNANYGRNESMAADGYIGDNTGFGGSASVQHSRQVKGFYVSNGLSVGCGIVNYLDHEISVNTGLSNNISTNAGPYQVSAGQSISYGQTRDGFFRNSVSNGVNMSIAGASLFNIQTQISGGFQKDIYAGDHEGYVDHRVRQVAWSAKSPTMSYTWLIPFAIDLSAGGGWYGGDVIGRSFNWSAVFTSPDFFMRDLKFEYRFDRSYDPNFNRQSTMHSIDSHYQWRAVILELRLQNYQLLNNTSNVWFSLSRPF